MSQGKCTPGQPCECEASQEQGGGRQGGQIADAEEAQASGQERGRNCVGNLGETV